jgi:hypothetical protein
LLVSEGSHPQVCIDRPHVKCLPLTHTARILSNCFSRVQVFWDREGKSQACCLCILSPFCSASHCCLGVLYFLTTWSLFCTDGGHLPPLVHSQLQEPGSDGDKRQRWAKWPSRDRGVCKQVLRGPSPFWPSRIKCSRCSTLEQRRFSLLPEKEVSWLVARDGNIWLQ